MPKGRISPTEGELMGDRRSGGNSPRRRGDAEGETAREGAKTPSDSFCQWKAEGRNGEETGCAATGRVGMNRR